MASVAFHVEMLVSVQATLVPAWLVVVVVVVVVVVHVRIAAVAASASVAVVNVPRCVMVHHCESQTWSLVATPAPQQLP